MPDLTRKSPEESRQICEDTIAAIATPPGRGGLGVVRLSGPRAFAVARQLLPKAADLEHGRAIRADVSDSSGTLLDEAVVTAFQAPRSYTGEDVVELSAHGSPIVLEAILYAALSAGARLAQPGEFTQRAFLSGRIDLTQAEAVHDLIAAHTLEQARMAAQQLGGALSGRLKPLKTKLVHLVALLEAGMDFAPGELDDVSTVPPQEIANRLEEIVPPLEALAGSFHRGQLLRRGAAIALVGAPNAGKSSLFNYLLERSRAIVTPLPGTTRDTLEEAFAIEGIPIRLVDTAGIRGGGALLDEAEAMGVERSREAMADADVVLFVHDATLPVSADERQIAAAMSGRPSILLYNKADLLEPGSHGKPELTTEEERSRRNHDFSGNEPIYTSAVTGEGVAELRAALLKKLLGEADSAGAALNNERQRQAVAEALGRLGAASEANAARLPHELLLVDLHEALTALDSLTGETTTEDILGRIFSSFCIGK